MGSIRTLYKPKDWAIVGAEGRILSIEVGVDHDYYTAPIKIWMRAVNYSRIMTGEYSITDENAYANDNNLFKIINESGKVVKKFGNNVY